MKKLLILYCLLISFAAKPQSSVITEIVQVPGKTAEQLYASFKKWIALSVVDYEAAMLLDLPEEKNIIFKTNTDFQFGVNQGEWTRNKYYIKVSCEFRDQRYKYAVEIESIEINGVIMDYDYFLTLSDFNTNLQHQKSVGLKGFFLKDKYINESVKMVLAAQEAVETSVSEIIESFKKYVAQPESTDW